MKQTEKGLYSEELIELYWKEVDKFPKSSIYKLVKLQMFKSKIFHYPVVIKSSFLIKVYYNLNKITTFEARKVSVMNSENTACRKF